MFKKILLATIVVAFHSMLYAEPAVVSSDTERTDIGWPRIITAASGTKIQIHQPQIDTWQDQKEMIAWSAVEFLTPNQQNSELGVVKWKADTSVALDERLVRFDKIQITQVNFPALGHTQARDVTAALSNTFPKEGLVLALDRVLAAVDKSIIHATNVQINTAPPPIFYSKRPAILVQFDGEPIVSPIKDSVLKFIVNTNWDILQDPDANMYYLRNDKTWFSSPNLEKGWIPAKKLPKSFETLPKDGNWKDVLDNIPGKSISKSSAPTIFVSKQPAEMLVTQGKPKTEKIENTKLLWVKNTECDLFQMKRGPYYLLVSGRWFQADKLEGPWVFATPNLPKDFLEIPRSHPRARVRAAIPGTDEAAEAVLLAQIPQTLRISKQNLQTPKVTYEGDPKFVDIKDTKLSYATNCGYDVLKYGDLYYLCFQGAWFQSRKADGPWELATSVPEEIYKIPSDCPLHHVTYVKVQSADTNSVTYVYTSGYSGVTVSFGIAMWGTGWYYPPYYRYGGYYPVYYPYPYSYGSYAVYNPRTGAYGYGSTVMGPNGGISRVSTYNPNTGTYARGTVAWTDSGVRASGKAYNPRTGTSFETRQGRNAQGSWGTSTIQRGDDWAQSGHVKTDQGSVSGIRTSEGNGVVRGSGENGSGFVGKHGDDIYAGKDGNVYRKTEEGWQKKTDDGWSEVQKPQNQPATMDKKADRPSNGSATGAPSTRDQLSRDAMSRSEGDRRVQQSNYNSSRGSGNYSRPSGSVSGGRTGGGGGGRRR